VVILPLMCSSCGWRLDLRSDEPLPKCQICNGKMRPAGKSRPCTAEELSNANRTLLSDRASSAPA
jgi:hypothetical protein